MTTGAGVDSWTAGGIVASAGCGVCDEQLGTLVKLRRNATLATWHSSDFNDDLQLELRCEYVHCEAPGSRSNIMFVVTSTTTV